MAPAVPLVELPPTCVAYKSRFNLIQVKNLHSDLIGMTGLSADVLQCAQRELERPGSEGRGHVTALLTQQKGNNVYHSAMQPFQVLVKKSCYGKGVSACNEFQVR